MLLLDFIRYHQRLVGTKIGCREGDCGACTVLVGQLKKGEIHYQTMVSCLAPMGNISGKHVVTIEGINMPGLNPIQSAMVEEGATQCGFCTPGFIMSLAGFCLDRKASTKENAIAAVDGNICRCTGYKSIERAAAKVASLIKPRTVEDPAQYAAQKGILPAYFETIGSRLSQLETTPSFHTRDDHQNEEIITAGGGTDLYVQKPGTMTHAPIRFLFDEPGQKDISTRDNRCFIGPSATVTDLMNSSIINETFPKFHDYAKLISSTPIRNMATLGGNLVNASPIGDFIIFFLALDASVDLEIYTPGTTGSARTIPLRELYKGYKQLAIEKNELIGQIHFEVPGKNSLFNFEKVSKRTHLDIASVNTAIHLNLQGSTIVGAFLSAGGLGPIALFMQRTSAFLTGKRISPQLVDGAIEIAGTEISPISDPRGSAEYKKLLLGQLIKAHFITLFPEMEINKLLSA